MLDSERDRKGKPMRTVTWEPEGPAVRMIDQRLLPAELKLIELHTPSEVAEAIRDMAVRGAPAIGATAAFGLALAGAISKANDLDALWRELGAASDTLSQARPTAHNLNWALERIMGAARAVPDPTLERVRQALVEQAQQIADQDVEINMAIGRYGAELIRDQDTVIHHCNTGALATVDYGTALGVIRTAHEQGKQVHVLVDETRPRLQGAKLTAWELEQYGIPYEIISDNAAGFFLSQRQSPVGLSQSGGTGANSGGDQAAGKRLIDSDREGIGTLVAACFVGADRVAANGDVANKIGTYMLALAAKANGVPFYVAVPTSTIDLSLPTGNQIVIEERDPDEVLGLQDHGRQVAPIGSHARNPAFDITPNPLVTAFVTEVGVVRPPYEETLAPAVRQAREATA